MNILRLKTFKKKNIIKILLVLIKNAETPDELEDP